MFWKIRLFFEKVFNDLVFVIGNYTNGLPQIILHKFCFRLPSREHILLLTKAKKLVGIGVEVGVFEGNYSKLILEHTKLKKLFSIDPWREFESEKYFDNANQKQEIQDQRYLITKQKLAEYGERSLLIRDTSEIAANQFLDASLDFIYIDANHSYEGCFQDLNLWWPKLRGGGLIAGDDYTDIENGATKYGVIKATNQFFLSLNQKLFVTYKSGNVHWSNWFVIKE